MIASVRLHSVIFFFIVRSLRLLSKVIFDDKVGTD